MSIVINTPTSNIGRALAVRLLDAGEMVTVLSRDKKKVDDLAKRGACVVEGSFEDPALLAKALERTTALRAPARFAAVAACFAHLVAQA